jgi:zinc/manganese transport system permease protein
VLVLAIAGVSCLVGLAVMGRPLLFATIDPYVAAARGVPVRAVGVGFLVLLGIAAAGTSQVTGSLLVFALLVAPAAAAARLTARPAAGLALSVGLALLVTWLGEAVAFFSPFPIGFWVTTFGFGTFLLATAYRAAADRVSRRPGVLAVAGGPG